jgi:hypothetical protein
LALFAHVLEAHGEHCEEVMNMSRSGIHLEFAQQVIDLGTKEDGENG